MLQRVCHLVGRSPLKFLHNKAVSFLQRNPLNSSSSGKRVRGRVCWGGRRFKKSCVLNLKVLVTRDTLQTFLAD